MKINNKDYTILVLRGMKALLHEFKALELKYSEYIKKVEGETYLIRFEDKDPDSKFHFTISNPNQTTDNQVLFNVSYIPREIANKDKPGTSNATLDTIKVYFETWVSLLVEYETLSVDAEDVFTKQYEEEFYHEFDIVDEDADTTAFDHKRQMAIYRLLTSIESKMKLDYPNDPEMAEIIEETKDLKNNIQNRTKRAVVRGLSKIMAKIKKHGLKYLQEFWDEARKEVYKQLLRGGDEIGEAIGKLFT